MVHPGYTAEEAMFGSTTGALQLLQWDSIEYATCTISKMLATRANNPKVFSRRKSSTYLDVNLILESQFRYNLTSYNQVDFTFSLYLSNYFSTRFLDKNKIISVCLKH
jgi:hypothetical protein